jgi:hypothetical protein
MTMEKLQIKERLKRKIHMHKQKDKNNAIFYNGALYILVKPYLT